jgi:hypothetical protein
MNPDDPLTFTRLPVAPMLIGETGVEIVLSKEPSVTGKNLPWLHGAYRIPQAEAARIATPPLQKALVITCVSGGHNDTRNLVGDAVLFEDDETVINGVHAGYFNYDLTDWLNMYERRKYLITVSLGHFISNTLEVEVNPVSMSGTNR